VDESACPFYIGVKDDSGKVNVSGSLAKDGSNSANAPSVVLADGKKVFAASSENEGKQ
jgi:hypothetical protein